MLSIFQLPEVAGFAAGLVIGICLGGAFALIIHAL